MSAAYTHSNAWRYGLLGLPLAFVSLPLYVTLPRHYAEHYAVPLGMLGMLLLITRVFDAVLDPRIGRWVDTLFEQSPYRSWLAAAWGSLVLALGFAALWNPPAQTQDSNAQLMLWLGASLVITYIAFSLVSMVHQAWAARWGGQPEQRARLVAWREGAAIVGVLLASILPVYLGLQVTSIALALTLGLGLWTLYQTLPAQLETLRFKQLFSLAQTSSLAQAKTSQVSSSTSPWRTPAFSALLVVFLLNGTASAMPATLLPFFVRDTLQAANWEPLFLGSYFVCAAAGIALWLRAVSRWGLARSWLLGMGLSVAVFAWVLTLGQGDWPAFVLVCMLSGAALGADLVLPAAMLNGLVADLGQRGRSEGVYMGWWSFATKLNLALAAGLALPLLGWLGYAPGQQDSQAVQALSLAYGLLPCVLKLGAAVLLYRFFIRQDSP